ncbi:MAG: helix-turn-helix transcriptional regulator [Anaerolineaceae bacterium]|nr:helix-turn-helix transcriptional regulator [Anaerolineaceae bacterium]
MCHINILTKRQSEVLVLLANGQPNKEIARNLGIAEHTVEQHLKHIYRKLEVRNRTEAAALYWEHHSQIQNNGNPLFTSD